MEIGDCCLDFELPESPFIYGYDSDMETRLLATAQSISEAALSKHLRCRTLPIFVEDKKTKYIFDEGKYYVVSCGLAEKYDIPVCSNGFIFENLACAKQHIQELGTSIENGSTYLGLEDFLCFQSVIKPMDYIRAYNFTYFVHLARSVCNTAYVFPEECGNTLQRMKCLTDTWECRREAEMNESTSLLQCLSHQDPVKVAGKLYHNQYCARCVLKETPLEVECARIFDIVGERGNQHAWPIPAGTLQFSIMLDFDGALHTVDLPAPVLSARTNYGEKRAEAKVGLLCCWFLVLAIPLST